MLGVSMLFVFSQKGKGEALLTDLVNDDSAKKDGGAD